MRVLKILGIVLVGVVIGVPLAFFVVGALYGLITGDTLE